MLAFRQFVYMREHPGSEVHVRSLYGAISRESAEGRSVRTTDKTGNLRGVLCIKAEAKTQLI
jgi:hypothetical protein